jgi:hypothetical protein
MGLETPSRGSSRAFSPSPLRDTETTLRKHGVPASQAAAFAAVDQSILGRKVGLPDFKGEINPIPFPNLRPGDNGNGKEESNGGAEDGSLQGEGEGTGEGGVEEEKKVSVNHVLTNVIVLQEFLLEVAALVQVRAGLFGEVRYV